MLSMVSPERAAADLLDALDIPRHNVSVWVWHKRRLVTLVVRLDPQVWYERAKVPKTFLGYPVRIEERETAIAN
jgi:hypothetical protein